MGEIYRKASLVYIWLGEPGPADTKTQDSIALARMLYRYWHSHGREGSRQLALKVARGELSDLESAMRKFHSPWHERVWAIQEFRLARRALLLFGSFSWTCSQLSHAARGLRNSNIQRAFPGRFRDYAIEQLYNRIRPISNPSKGVSQPQGIRLHQRLRLIQSTAATDPGDFVYGILSLLDASEARLIDVDYDLPVQKVFTQATYASLKAREAHTILADLHCDQSADRTAGLPSWAIDFSPDRSGARGTQPVPWEMPLGMLIAASRLHVTSPSLDAACERLTLSGLRCGTVQGTQSLATRQKLRDTISWIDSMSRPRIISERNRSPFLRRALHQLPVPPRRREEGEWYAEASCE